VPRRQAESVGEELALPRGPLAVELDVAKARAERTGVAPLGRGFRRHPEVTLHAVRHPRLRPIRVDPTVIRLCFGGDTPCSAGWLRTRAGPRSPGCTRDNGRHAVPLSPRHCYGRWASLPAMMLH